MKRRVMHGAWLALLIGLIAPGAGAADERRFVSLAPHLTELAYEAGIGDRLVGAVAWSDFPPAAAELPRIGDAFRFDLEAIVRLRATDALAWRRGTPRQAIDELDSLGIDVHVLATPTLDAIADALLRLGELGGSPETARRAAAAFQRRRAALAGTFARGDAPVPIFYQVSRQPLFTLGRNHVINDVFALCGARNVFGDLDTAAAAVDLEAVLEADPVAIVAGRDGEADALAHWHDHGFLRAVRCNNLLAVDPALLVRPTPRLLDGARMLCEWLDEGVRRAEDPACRIDRD
jgi:iron complex transport system substrate-binding protein